MKLIFIKIIYPHTKLQSHKNESASGMGAQGTGIGHRSPFVHNKSNKAYFLSISIPIGTKLALLLRNSLLGFGDQGTNGIKPQHP
jgi:hypothetical protein